MRDADPRSFYCRTEHTTGERSFFAYKDTADGFYRALPGDGNFAERPSSTAYGLRVLSSTIFGHPAPRDRTHPRTNRTRAGATDQPTDSPPRRGNTSQRASVPQSRPSEPVPVVTSPSARVGSQTTELPVALLSLLFPRIAILLGGPEAPEPVQVSRLLGFLNAQIDTATAVVLELDSLQAQLAIVRAERDRWQKAYVLLSQSSRRPASSGTRSGPESDAGDADCNAAA